MSQKIQDPILIYHSIMEMGSILFQILYGERGHKTYLNQASVGRRCPRRPGISNPLFPWLELPFEDGWGSNMASWIQKYIEKHTSIF